MFGSLARLLPAPCQCRGEGHEIAEQSEYEAAAAYTQSILDIKERREIARARRYLLDGEKVLVVARQSRALPGATLIFSPNTILCTSSRIIIRNPMLFGLREHVDYYRHRDIRTIRIVRGRFSSSLIFTVPGMGTAARSDSCADNGVIGAIPHEKAEEIYRVIMGHGKCAGGEGRGGNGGGSGDGGGMARGNAGCSDRAGSERRAARTAVGMAGGAGA